MSKDDMKAIKSTNKERFNMPTLTKQTRAGCGLAQTTGRVMVKYE